MTAAESDAPRMLGTLHSAGTSGFVRLEEHLDAPVGTVWKALTGLRELGAWLGELAEMSGEPLTAAPSVGSGYRARYFASGWEGTCRIVACDQGRSVRIATSSEDEPEGLMKITLAPHGTGTLLVFEDHGLPPANLAAYAAGDQIHVEDLRAHLAGKGRCDARRLWQELHPLYLQQPTH